MNGVVTAISNGICIDLKTLTKNCKQCQYWKQKKGTYEYEKNHFLLIGLCSKQKS